MALPWITSCRDRLMAQMNLKTYVSAALVVMVDTTISPQATIRKLVMK
jgi:hypothetical protein